MEYSAASIANAFLNQGFRDSVSVSPMKIQKLLYLAQGYYLWSHSGDSLFEEDFEAWQFGPVIRSIYVCCKHFASDGITSFIKCEVPDSSPETPAPIPLEKSVRDLVSYVWETYGGYPATQLSQWTHEPNAPWDKTRRSHPYQRKPTISKELIRQYFTDKLGAP